MQSILGDSLKKVILAGIGAVATTAEKSKDLLDDMVEKGELTVEQGKVLNEELKHNIKSAVKGAGEVVDQEEPAEASAEDILKGLSAEQIAALKEALAKVPETEE